MPLLQDCQDLTKITSLLDHIFHPAAIIHFLMGQIGQITYGCTVTVGTLPYDDCILSTGQTNRK
jgi:hypothetical protein